MVRKLNTGEVYKWYKLETNNILSSYVVSDEDIWVDENGFVHNEANIPAKIYYTTIGHKQSYLEYVNHGKYHNLNGLAVVWLDNRLISNSYFINGVALTKYNWEIEVNRIKMLEEI